MKRHFVLILFIILFSNTVYASAINSNELINNAKKYDGETIAFSGEAIGEAMQRGEFGWINVNDGDNAIGVWVENSLLKEISFTGNYKTRGDTLEVTGVFHRACPEHGGDLDIHAQTMRKISDGKIIVHESYFLKVKLILSLLGVLFLLWILSLFRRK